jgi:hypothetical protein
MVIHCQYDCSCTVTWSYRSMQFWVTRSLELKRNIFGHDPSWTLPDMVWGQLSLSRGNNRSLSWNEEIWSGLWTSSWHTVFSYVWDLLRTNQTLCTLNLPYGWAQPTTTFLYPAYWSLTYSSSTATTMISILELIWKMRKISTGCIIHRITLAQVAWSWKDLSISTSTDWNSIDWLAAEKLVIRLFPTTAGNHLDQPHWCPRALLHWEIDTVKLAAERVRIHKK